MKTFNDEDLIFQSYKSIPSRRIRYVGNYFRCSRVFRLTRWLIYNKSWISNFSKNDPPPDFYNIKHKIMMEVMRIDDSVGDSTKKSESNSFKKTNQSLTYLFGKDYKAKRDDISIYFLPDTSDTTKFNFSGYLKTFERVLTKHSNRVQLYRRNHPECNDLVFLVSDESNCYIQVASKEDLLKDGKMDIQLKNAIFHGWYSDNQFLKIIKNCGADYVIWVGWYKTILLNNKEIKTPLVCIYDVKNIKNDGVVYDYDLMIKVSQSV